jgi:hypothetical protein
MPCFETVDPSGCEQPFQSTNAYIEFVCAIRITPHVSTSLASTRLRHSKLRQGKVRSWRIVGPTIRLLVDGIPGKLLSERVNIGSITDRLNIWSGGRARILLAN